MKTKINSIPGKMDTYWVSDVNAILDVVTNYSIPLKDFSEAILGKGLHRPRLTKPVHGLLTQVLHRVLCSLKFIPLLERKYFLNLQKTVSNNLLQFNLKTMRFPEFLLRNLLQQPGQTDLN